MRISNEPIQEGLPVKFMIEGFPEESAVRASIERFYSLKKDAPREFLVFNAFAEQIFSGQADARGKIAIFTYTPRPGKPLNSDKLS